jgi:hypothetical protein
MKFKLIILCILFLGINSNTFAIDKPDFVWEQHYSFPNTNVSPWLSMKCSENEIMVWVEGYDSIARTYSVIKSDNNGNILIQKDYSRPDSIDAFLLSSRIFSKNNLYEIFGLYANTINLMGPYLPLKKFEIDEECNVTGNISDLENKEQLISIASPNYLYDSVYIGIRDWYFLPDSVNIGYLQSLLVYDSDCKFIRKLTLDTAGINDSLNLRFPQVNIFPNKEGNIIASFQAKLQDTAVFGKTNYIYFCRYNLSGEMIWKSKLDISQNGFTGMSVQKIFQREDGSYNFLGRLFRGDFNKSEFGAIMGQISESGEIEWSKVINYESLDIVPSGEIKVIGKGDYFVLYGYGFTGLDKRHYWILIVDKDGNKLDEYKWNNEIDDNTISISDVQETESGNLIILGLDGRNSVYIAEIKPRFVNSVNDKKSKSISITISPNPATEFIEITQPSEGLEPSEGSKVQIYDVLGVEVISVETQRAVSLQRIDISHLPTGVYYLRIGNSTKMFVKV